MFENIIYIFLALLGIGFLIFIHELGHYFMAKRAGIRVEAFAIGFGKPIVEWERNGVKWRICWLPFGGYVKMAGTEKKGEIEPSEVKDGFFGVKPWARIKVAAMGPIVNIAFAFLAFVLLFFMGGRDKPFSEFTNYIGWVEKDSKLFESKIRSGDEITTLNNKPFKNFQSLLYAAVLDKPPITISGYAIDYFTQKKRSFTFEFPVAKGADEMGRARAAMSSLRPAEWLVYKQLPGGRENPLLPNSPMEESGIQYGDRVVWVDGELIFSNLQLVRVVNNPKVLLTVEREGKTFLAKVPRVQIRDLRLTKSEKEELDDYRHASKLDQKVDQLFFIPYNLSSKGVVENPLGYIGANAESKSSYEPIERQMSHAALQEGDKILAVQGEPVDNSGAIFSNIQEKRVLMVVSHEPSTEKMSWQEADHDFENSYHIKDLEVILAGIGSPSPVLEKGTLKLLRPITPIPMKDFPLVGASHKAREKKFKKYEEKIEDIEDPAEKKQALQGFARYKERLMLGLSLQDRLVAYNPSPFVLFGDVFKETYRTLFALLTGYVSPKNIAGPVGMVQVVHHSWTLGGKEALYWLGMISLNLGLLNLLPIPVLDGGYIVLAFVEMITKKPLKAKTMERLIIPFVLLVIGFFIYLTYHDLARIITRLF